jgi:hypothetical protein
MKRRILTGLLLGLFAGIIDVIPMIVQHLSWYANFSAFSMWIIIGIFMAVTQFQLKGLIKGLVISFCFLIPCLILIMSNGSTAVIPIISMTAILGSLIGLLYQKIIKE